MIYMKLFRVIRKRVAVGAVELSEIGFKSLFVVGLIHILGQKGVQTTEACCPFTAICLTSPLQKIILLR